MNPIDKARLAQALPLELDENRLTLSEDQAESFLARPDEDPKVIPGLRDLFYRTSVFAEQGV